MPNLAAALKEEIRRLARKEVKTQTEKTKRAVGQYRRDIAQLKRLIDEQKKKISLLAGASRDPSGEESQDDDSLKGVRFSARSVRAQRQRLGLSADAYGKLVGVSALTVYKWEQGKARPRRAQLEALVAVRGIKKREAAVKLSATKKEKTVGKQPHRLARGRGRKAK
jgi:DNA-binding transcriptional regulator YiaG